MVVLLANAKGVLATRTLTATAMDRPDRSRKRRSLGEHHALGEHHGGSFGMYMDHKIRKLRLQNASLVGAARSQYSEVTRDSSNTSSNTELFARVHVHVDGYTTPSKEELRQLLLLHGGGFEHYETPRVTHIIATHLPVSKLRQLKCVIIAL